jgi:hypothetical protein
MKGLFNLACPGLALCVSLSAASVIVRTDAPCRLLIDGKQKATLAEGAQAKLRLPAGPHHVEAVALTGAASWAKTVLVASAKSPQEVRVNLLAASSYWRDVQTGLVWTMADNASGLSWLQAGRYCEALRLAGFDDWRLPAIDDLQALFLKPETDGAAAAGGSMALHFRGPLKLTGWEWSRTPGTQAGEGWAFDFGDGGRASVAAGDSGLNRALCVRAER